MFTLFLSQLTDIVSSITTTAPALIDRSLIWKRQALVRSIPVFSSLIHFQTAVQTFCTECLAIAEGRTPVVKVILRKHILTLQQLATQLSDDLIELDLFFPPYANPLLIYTMNTEQKIYTPIGIHLWLTLCPEIVMFEERSTTRITYPTTLPSINHIDILPDSVIFPEWEIGEQNRACVLFKTKPQATEDGRLNNPSSIQTKANNVRLRHAIKSQLSFATLDIRSPNEVQQMLDQTSYVLHKLHQSRQEFSALLQEHFELASILR